jgi:hypothetical protein
MKAGAAWLWPARTFPNSSLALSEISYNMLFG